MPSLTRRRISAEHMDDPRASRQELSEALRFIRIVNRRLGGAKAALKHFIRWSGREHHHWRRDQAIRILDIGTGAADIPLEIIKWARRAGFGVHITAVDLHPLTLDLAREFVGSAADEIEFVQADALRLMDHFHPGQFDYAHAGMFLHHLQDIEVITVLRIMDRLTSRGLIWNDLVRGWIGKLGVRLLTLPALGAPKHVRHDAIVSIDAGFLKHEALDLARRAGLTRIKCRKHLLHRFTLVSEKAAVA